MNTKENYDHLIVQINIFIRKYYFNSFLKGLIFLGAWLFSVFILITISEYFGNFNSPFRTVLFYGFILLNTILVCWLILPSILSLLKINKTLTHDEAAEIIGNHFSDIHDKLLNTLQLKKLANDSLYNRDLVEASINQKASTLSPLTFPKAIDIRENLKYIKWALIPAALICIIGLAAPAILTESTIKLIRHNENFPVPMPFKFIVENSNLSVLQGDNFMLDIRLEGNKLPAVVSIQTENNTFKVDRENVSHFHYLFSNQQQNTTFRLLGNGFTSKQYEIKVMQKPILLNFDAYLNYPSYLNKKDAVLHNAGDMTVPAGTKIKWLIHTQNTDKLALNINGKRETVSLLSSELFEFKQRILKNTNYSIIPENGVIQHSDSASYRVNVVPDEMPSLTVNEKKDSVSMNSFFFNGNIRDDYGFTSLTFHYEVSGPGQNEGKKTFNLPVKVDLLQTQSDFFYFWNIKDIGIKAGQKVTYYFEVADNDGVNGPKKARSPEQTLNIPDAKTLNNELNTGTQAIKDKMESAIKMAAALERESQKLNQLLLNKNNLTFDEKKQIEDLIQKRNELNNLVKNIQDDNKKNIYNRQENQKQDMLLTEKQHQMEDLVNNVLDPKTTEMIQKLQEMLNSEQKEDTRNELSKMQTDNKSLKKELNRLLELYKKLEFEQKLNQDINQINQLADEQQKLAERVDQNSKEQSELAKEQQKQNQSSQEKQKLADQIKHNLKEIIQLEKEQQKLNSDFSAIKKSMEDLQRENEKSDHKQDFENPAKEMQGVEQKMQKSAEDLKNKNNSEASKTQKQASQDLKQVAENMQQKEAEGEEKENNVNETQLRELLKNLVNSSFDQENVMQALKGTSTSDPNYIVLAQKQKNIKDNLKTAEDSLEALARRIPQIQSTVNKEISTINTNIDQALESLGERRTPEAGKSQQFAMTSMNNLALMLSEVLDQLQNESGKGKAGKGKGKQMSISQLSKMQQQLNQNMQKARQEMQQQGNEGKGQNGKGAGMSEQLAKLAREQETIREALQKINRDENKDGTGGLGNLDKISRQMEQNVHDLVNRKINDELTKRQEEIKSRLLEAEKAQKEREQDQQRESNAGKQISPGYIQALKQFQQLKENQTEQVKTIPPTLNLFYKTKIKSYFDFINIK